MAHGVRIKLFTGAMPAQRSICQSNCLSPHADEVCFGREASGCMVVKRF
jgi:hypothetical protein